MPSQRYGEGKPSMMQKKGKSALFYTRFPPCYDGFFFPGCVAAWNSLTTTKLC